MNMSIPLSRPATYKPFFTLKGRFLIFVCLPALIAGIYFGIIASNMYISTTVFTLRGSEGNPSSDILAMFSFGTHLSANDAHILQQFISSFDMLKYLNQELGLRGHFSDKKHDIISRLEKNPTDEDFLEYYQWIIQLNYDSTTGILTMKAKAFSPEFSQKIAGAILKKSEIFINQLNERSRQDQLELTRSEVALAEARITQIRSRLKNFRSENEAIDPGASTGTLLNVVAQLEGQAAGAKAELTEAMSYMREDSARIVSLKAKIQALENQIVLEKSRMTGDNQRVLNDVITEYERLVLEREFAEKQYTSALSSLEATRIRAESTSLYLVAIQKPTLPDESLYPRRITFTVMTFFVAIMAFGIVSLMVAAIREHVGV